MQFSGQGKANERALDSLTYFGCLPARRALACNEGRLWHTSVPNPPTVRMALHGILAADGSRGMSLPPSSGGTTPVTRGSSASQASDRTKPRVARCRPRSPRRRSCGGGGAPTGEEDDVAGLVSQLIMRTRHLRSDNQRSGAVRGRRDGASVPDLSSGQGRDRTVDTAIFSPSDTVRGTESSRQPPGFSAFRSRPCRLVREGLGCCIRTVFGQPERRADPLIKRNRGARAYLHALL